MNAQTVSANVVGAANVSPSDRALCERVHGEYREMPGLRLTLSQASRLFNVEMTRCSQVLGELVAQGALWTNGSEFFAGSAGRRSA